jgi:hypothetical protein
MRTVTIACLLLLAVTVLAGEERRGAAAGIVDAGGVWRLAQAESRGMEFAVFIRLKPGMTEAELLQRAGPPDYESTEGTDTRARTVIEESAVIDPVTGNIVPQTNVVRSERTEIVKSWYYLPTTADPFTTRVTLTGGRIATIERTKKF